MKHNENSLSVKNNNDTGALITPSPTIALTIVMPDENVKTIRDLEVW